MKGQVRGCVKPREVIGPGSVVCRARRIFLDT